MNVWKLIAHHEQYEEALDAMKERNLIAIGWSAIGDLRERAPADARAIGSLIKTHHADSTNAATGGPSLWNLYREMDNGDLVIIAAGGQRRFVMEVVGDYFYADEANDLIGYRHQRMATVAPLDADELWAAAGARVAEGENHMWTLARCSPPSEAGVAELFEGRRFEVHSTAVERNPQAREQCIAHHGVTCFVCKFDFEQMYGQHGKGYVHVHHRNQLANAAGPRMTDPVNDLVPLCPNCHAMVHRGESLVAPEALRELIARVKLGDCDAMPAGWTGSALL